MRPGMAILKERKKVSESENRKVLIAPLGGDLTYLKYRPKRCNCANGNANITFPSGI